MGEHGIPSRFPVSSSSVNNALSMSLWRSSNPEYGVWWWGRGRVLRDVSWGGKGRKGAVPAGLRRSAIRTALVPALCCRSVAFEAAVGLGLELELS